MTNEEAKEIIKDFIKDCKANNIYLSSELIEALDMGNKALEIVNDFEKARILTGNRLNGRTYAYKCGLADGQRLAKGGK